MKSNYIKLVEALSKKIVKKISFDVINPTSLIRYGLRPHTRSISWLAEQIISQHIKYYQNQYNIEKFEESKTDISVWDFKIRFKNFPITLYINSKITNLHQKKQRNDMSSIKKLYSFLQNNKNVKLLYLIFPFEFKGKLGNRIEFSNKTIIGEYIKMKDFYLNPRNEHLQAFYDVENIERNYEDFIKLIYEKQSKGKKFLK